MNHTPSPAPVGRNFFCVELRTFFSLFSEIITFAFRIRGLYNGEICFWIFIGISEGVGSRVVVVWARGLADASRVLSFLLCFSRKQWTNCILAIKLADFYGNTWVNARCWEEWKQKEQQSPLSFQLQGSTLAQFLVRCSVGRENKLKLKLSRKSPPPRTQAQNFSRQQCRKLYFSPLSHLFSLLKFSSEKSFIQPRSLWSWSGARFQTFELI